MSQAKTTIVEHASAADLPPRFRGEIDPTRSVMVVVTEEEDTTPTISPKYPRYWGVAAERKTSVEEAVARVRELRDEWDDR